MAVTKLPRPQDPKALRFLTIHCTATPAGRHHHASEIVRWDRAKFGQASYHWVVLLDGTMVQCLQDNEVGAHVGGHNTGNIGVAYVGGLALAGGKLVSADTRTPGQMAGLAGIVRAYRRSHPGIIVRGHRDWSPDLDRDGKIERHEWVKDCPCFDVAAWCASIGINAVPGR